MKEASSEVERLFYGMQHMGSFTTLCGILLAYSHVWESVVKPREI
jgi:hypothetical protein